jgi:hypothetical protein
VVGPDGSPRVVRQDKGPGLSLAADWEEL